MSTTLNPTPFVASSAEWKDTLDDILPRQGEWTQEQYLVLTSRIPEYWIVNPQTETITVLRLEADGYVEAGQYRRGETALSVLLPGCAVAVALVFESD